MDGVHDLGGLEGFGPIPVDHEHQAFQHGWEGRQWALDRVALADDWTIDWWRHVLERLPPQVYLTIPYFEKWTLTNLACLVDSGVFTIDEILAGHTDKRGSARAAKSVDEVLAENRASAHSFRVEIDVAPRFAVGDAVRTLRQVSSDHTRLPRYARGGVGAIIDQNGAHPLPDKSAKGEQAPQHLYTVAFTARELWGAEAAEADTVRLDLWESYLVPA